MSQLPNPSGDEAEHEAVLRRYEELQLRVTRFSAVEQQLAQARDRLDRETAVFNRMHGFNTSAFKEMPQQEFVNLVAEALVDIFEVEFGIFCTCGDSKADHLCYGVHGVAFADKQIRSITEEAVSKLKPDQVNLLGSEKLVAWQSTLLVNQMFAMVLGDADQKPTMVLMAGITRSGARLYEPLAADRKGAFAVFAQQVAAHSLNQQGRRTIQQHVEKIHRSEQQLALAMRGADLGLWDWNLQTNQLTFNDRWANMLGFRVDELRPHYNTWRELVDPVDLIRVEKLLEQHLTGEAGQIEAEIRMRTKQGDWRWILTRGKIVDRDFFGRPLRASGTHLDITERRRAEAALQESELRYRSLVTNMREVAFQTDIQGRWVLLNEAWTEVTGFEVADSLGRCFLDFVYPEDREMNGKKFKPLINREKEYCRHEIRYITKSGGFKWLEVHARLMLDSANNPTGTAGTLRDVTAQREAEEKLAAALFREQELNRLRSGFITMASHEFRTPLAGIMHAAELLRDFRSEMNATDQDRYLQLILAGTRRIDQLIEDVLVLGRAQSGRLKYQPEPIGLAPLLDQWIADLPVSETNRKRIRLLNHRQTEQCVADRELLRHVVMNLLTNALKYSAEELSVDLELSETVTGESCLEVRDRGIGIPADELDEIFDPFHRASNVGKIKGSGVGLATAKSCVELMHGRIEVQSEVARGTTFRVFLPSAESAAQATTSANMLDQNQSKLV